MITAKAFSGKHYAVLGLARSGLATVEALLASGARVTAWDGDPQRTENLRSSRATNGLELADLDQADLTQFDSLVLSPGVPLNRSPLAARAREAGVEIIGDIELFARARPELPPHKVVGITGTNGKSTTTALVHHILQTAGVPSLMGGNIGLPILAQDQLPEGGVYVLELSSYQLDLTKSLHCEVAALTNITPDHLDRYENFAEYEHSKARLFAMQTEDGIAIWDTDNPGVLPFTDIFDDERLPFRSWLNRRHPKLEALVPYQSPALAGSHNLANSSIAFQVSEALRIREASILKALGSFSGLPHRLERVREKDGVTFVNDSKATNPTATAPALAAFPAVRWILGGQAKSDNLDECAPHFGHVRKAYTIGEASTLFASLLKPHMAVAECGTLEVAVKAAASDSQPGETVLLSPACASFDQFRDFEARGDAFRAAVEAL